MIGNINISPMNNGDTLGYNDNNDGITMGKQTLCQLNIVMENRSFYIGCSSKNL